MIYSPFDLVGLNNHFKSAELKQSCNFWVEMELESGGMAGTGSTDM